MLLIYISTLQESTLHRPHESITLREVFGSFTLDLQSERDFLWVCVGRLFSYVPKLVAEADNYGGDSFVGSWYKRGLQ